MANTPTSSTNNTGASRVFQIGSTTVHEDDSMTGLTNEQCRAILQKTFPEVANATIRETKKDGVTTVAFLPKAGKKG